MIRNNKLIDIVRIGFSLAKVTFRLRIENSYLGVFWYLLNPLILFFILYSVRQAAFSGEEIPFFSLYLLLGIAGFNFMKSVITGAIDVISSNPDYIKSINRVAPESLVVSVVFHSFFSHIFEFIMVIALSLYLGAPLVGLLAYPVVLLIFSLLLLGVAFIFSSVGTYVSDLNNIWLIVSQLLLLATPIFYVIYPGSILYFINLFNPLFYFLEIVRPLVIYGKMPANFLLSTFSGFTIIYLAVGVAVFRHFKKKFAELI